MKSVPCTLFLFLGLVGLSASRIFAVPLGTETVAGQVSITQSGAEMRITASDGAILNHSSFDVSRGETLRFIQPGVDARVLNRILSASPSRIDGRLLANGHLYLVNPAGVLFGSGAVVEVGKLHAIAGRLSNDDFLAGRDRFRELSGEVRNEGSILSEEVVLAGAAVSNLGRIHAPGGLVVMAAGDSLELVSSDGSVAVTYEGGSSVAPFGAVFAVGDLAGHALLQSGVVEASRVEVRAGSFQQAQAGSIRAFQSSGGGGSVRVEAMSQAEFSGTIDATGTIGGQVAATADTIHLSNASIDASGSSGGGEILIGGGYQGKDASLANAAVTFAETGVDLQADALDQGDGGLVVLWSDRYTGFHGKASAHGGPLGGDGGLIETSSKGTLSVTGTVDVSSAFGQSGTWLLDPASILIVETGDDTNISSIEHFGSMSLSPKSVETSILTTSTIETALAAGNSVDISTGYPSEGTSLSLDEGVTLTLQGETTQTLTLNSETITIPATASIISEGPSLTLNGGHGFPGSLIQIDGTILSKETGNKLTLGMANIAGNVEWEHVHVSSASANVTGKLTAYFFQLDGDYKGPGSTLGGTISVNTIKSTDTLALTGDLSGEEAEFSSFDSITQNSGSLIFSKVFILGTEAHYRSSPSYEGDPSVSLNSSSNQIAEIAFGAYLESASVRNFGSMAIVKHVTIDDHSGVLTMDSYANMVDVRVSGGDLTVSSPLTATDKAVSNSLLLAAEGDLILNVTPEQLDFSTRLLYGQNLTKGESFDDNGSLDAFSTLSGISFDLSELNATLDVPAVQTLAKDNPDFVDFEITGIGAVTDMSDQELAALIDAGTFSQYSFFLEAPIPGTAAANTVIITETGGPLAIFGDSFKVLTPALDDSFDDDSGVIDLGSEVVPLAPVSRPVLSLPAQELLDDALSDDVETRLEKYLNR